MASLAMWKLLKAAQGLLEEILYKFPDIFAAYASQGLASAPGHLSALPRAALGMQQGRRQSTPCSIEAARREGLSDFALSGRSSSDVYKGSKANLGYNICPRAILLEQAPEEKPCKYRSCRTL